MLSKMIRDLIPPLDRGLFDARSNYKRIVIFDWNSRLDTLRSDSPAAVVRDALYKWDQTVRKASPDTPTLFL